jgi:hypothetical protein
MRRQALVTFPLIALLILAALPAHAVDPKTRRLSIKNNGEEIDQSSDGYIDGLSNDGKLAAFTSDGALVSADGNVFSDIYFRNLRTDRTRGVSIEGDANSDGPAVSGNGKFVVFWSQADNLVPNDGDGDSDIFRFNVETRNLRLVSRDAVDAGGQPAVNFSGRFVAFDTASQLVNKDNNHVDDIYLRDFQNNTIRLISVDSNGNDTVDGASLYPTISASGRFVAFESDADDLIGNDDNNSRDIFVRDRSAGTTRRASIKTNGNEKTGESELAVINADGSLIAFHSAAKLSAADDNAFEDIYLRNRNTGHTILITLDRNGNPTNDESVYPAISPNGRLIGFYSYATDLIANDPDGEFSAFVFDRQLGKLVMIDRSNSGTPGDMESYVTGISNRFVLFSTDSALVGSDDNTTDDVYRRGPYT